MTTVGELVAVLRADAKQFSGTMVAAEAQTKSLGGTMTSVSKAVSTAFIAAGAVAGAAILKGVSATQQWASDTRSLQRITGQTAESASGLLGAANLLGISVSSLSVGFGTLSKNAVNGSTSLTKYGIATRDAQGQTLPFDDVLGNVIDKFSTLKPGAEQTAFAMNVFGRSGKDLIPILMKGRDGLAELEQKAAALGVVMSQDDVNASKALTEAQHTLSLAFKGASISIGKLFIPVITKVVNFATRAVQVITRLPGPVKAVGLSFTVAAGAVATIVLAFQKLTSIFGPVVSGLTDIGKALLQSGLFQDVSAGLQATSTGIQLVGQEAGKSGQQLSLFGDQGTTALNDVQGAASAATIAVEAGTAKQAGAFEKLGAKFASVGSKLAGWASTAAAVVTSAFDGVGEIVVIVAAVAAAVAVATVVITKNWSKVGAAFTSLGRAAKPILDAVKAAFGQVMSAANQLGSALADAFNSFAAALQPLLPIITPILAIIGKALVFLTAAPFVATLVLLVLTLKGVALGLRVAADIVEFFANTVIKGVNLVIKAINSVIGASNEFLHTNFQTIDTIDALSLSSSTAATSVTTLAPALDKAAQSSGGLGKAIAAVRPLLDQMQTSFKDISAGALDAYTKAQQTAGSTTESVTAAVQAFADQQIAAAQKASQAFHDQAQSALTFTTTMLSALEQTAQQAQQTLAGDTSSLSNSALAQLRDQAHITATDILSTFRAAGAQTKQFGHNLLELSRIGGQAGKDLASALLTSGDVLSAQVIADAPAKIQRQIVTAFGKSQSAADSFATKLTNAIVGPIRGLEKLFVEFARKAFHVHLSFNDGGSQKKTDHLQHSVDNLVGPAHTLKMAADDAASAKVNSVQSDVDHLVGHHYDVKVGLDTSKVQAQLRNFDSNLSNFLSEKRTVDIAVHTHAASPWPDEALKKHLTDPLGRAGFKKINGRWTLPLDVGVHSSLSPRGGPHGSLSPIGGDGSDTPNPDAWWRAATWMPKATAHLPTLPSGNTHMFDQRHHHRSGGDIRVILDRRHYDEAQSFQEDYGRGF